MPNDRKLIGRILIEMGLVTEAQIQEALAVQWQRYDRIGNILVRLGYVTEEEVLLALGTQSGRNVADLDLADVPREVIEKISPIVARIYRVVPVRFENEALIVAMPGALDAVILNDLKFLLGCEVHGVLSTEDAVNKAIAKYFPPAGDSIPDISSKADGEATKSPCHVFPPRGTRPDELAVPAGEQPHPPRGEPAVPRLRGPLRVKPFVGVLTGFPELLPEVKKILVWRLGEIDIESDLLDFDFTDYYEKEMGRNLKRKFYSFRQLRTPEALADQKTWTNDVERAFARRASGKARGIPLASPALPRTETPVARPINLDPGYVSLAKVVLASTKDYSHRIYLRDGIYAEVTLTFTKGRFEPWPWTFPDYRLEAYLSFFNSVRAALKETGVSK